MFKLFFATFSLVLLGGFCFVLISYRVVQTKDGIHLIERKELGFSRPVVDTRDWTPMDYIKDTEISKALTKKKLSNALDRAERNWRDLTDSIDDLVNDNDLEDASDKAKRKVSEVRKKVKHKYEKLVDKLESEKITAEEFKAKVAELREWADREIKKIKAKFA